MSIYLWSSKISKVYIWWNEVSAVYKWTTKIRPDIIPVTWVTLNKSSISFTAKNQTNQLTATVSPATATNKNVTWSSSNTSIATVSSSGLVTSKDAWTCNITVTTQDWWYTANCGVTVTLTTTDYSYTSYTGNLIDCYWRYFIKITALKSWKIKTIWFVNWYAKTWTLWIREWSDPKPWWTTYSVSNAYDTYSLWTPYQITSWNTYTLAFEPSVWWGKWTKEMARLSSSDYLPQTRTAVRFDSSWYADSSDVSEVFDRVFFFQYLVIDYT